MATQLLLEGGLEPMDQIHPERILEYAIQNGFSRHGEMFNASSMVKIAEDHLHFRAQTLSLKSHETLLELLVGAASGNRAVLMPYDADKDHTPCLAQGHSAHWCLLTGVCMIMRSGGMPTQLSPDCYRQTQSNSAHYIVNNKIGVEDFTTNLEKLFESTETLMDSLDKNFIYVFTRHGKTSHLGLWSLRDLLRSNGNLVEVDPRRSDPQEYVLPPGGLEDGLQNKVVFVMKQVQSSMA
jgi:hypothetical protein